MSYAHPIMYPGSAAILAAADKSTQAECLVSCVLSLVSSFLLSHFRQNVLDLISAGIVIFLIYIIFRAAC